jgi:hypothetical protein
MREILLCFVIEKNYIACVGRYTLAECAVMAGAILAAAAAAARRGPSG